MSFDMLWYPRIPLSNQIPRPLVLPLLRLFLPQCKLALEMFSCKTMIEISGRNKLLYGAMSIHRSWKVTVPRQKFAFFRIFDVSPHQHV